MTPEEKARQLDMNAGNGYVIQAVRESETKQVTFKIKQSDIALWNASHQWATEPGEYEVMVGKSSADTIGTTFALK